MRFGTVIRITRAISIDEGEIEEHFVRASGPGGQKVNKVSTAVQLRFDVGRSKSLPSEVRDRLLRMGGRRITDDGVLIIDARRYRMQQRNRQDAMERLIALIRKAAPRPKKRRKTKPTLASKRRRLDSKRRRSQTKDLRRPVADQ